MKLKAIQTYQSVKFQGKQDNFFSAGVSSMPDVKISYQEGYVRIESAKDCIVVFTANVAYAVPADAEQAPAEQQKRGRMTDIDHNKAPKT